MVVKSVMAVGTTAISANTRTVWWMCVALRRLHGRR